MAILPGPRQKGGTRQQPLPIPPTAAVNPAIRAASATISVPTPRMRPRTNSFGRGTDGGGGGGGGGVQGSPLLNVPAFSLEKPTPKPLSGSLGGVDQIPPGIPPGVGGASDDPLSAEEAKGGGLSDQEAEAEAEAGGGGGELEDDGTDGLSESLVDDEEEDDEEEQGDAYDLRPLARCTNKKIKI